MAMMIPADVEGFKTDGERRFYRFLSAAAKPDSSFLAWYTPDLQGKEPDFILYSDSVGLVVFEVKDWVLDQIREANPHQFMLGINGKLNPTQKPAAAGPRLHRRSQRQDQGGREARID